VELKIPVTIVIQLQNFKEWRSKFQ